MVLGFHEKPLSAHSLQLVVGRSGLSRNWVTHLSSISLDTLFDKALTLPVHTKHTHTAAIVAGIKHPYTPRLRD